MEKVGWNYDAIIFENFNELKKEAKDTAYLFPTLLSVHFSFDDSMQKYVERHFDSKELENSQIRLFPNYEEFAAYEVYEGWYSTGLQEGFGTNLDFNGAPNLLNFIDYKELGKQLEDTMDPTTHLKLNEQGAIIELLN